MDHMSISGMNTHQWSLAKKVAQKLKSDAPKVPNQAKAKRDDIKTSQNYNFSQFQYGKFWCSQNATNQPKLTVELGYMCQFSNLHKKSPKIIVIKIDVML